MRNSAFIILALSLAASCVSTGAPRSSFQSSPPANPFAADQFERIKALAGNWQWAPELAPELTGLVASYRITAGGSCVIETLFPGDAFEIVTVYHLDRDQLLLTHYSTAGNQPTMRAATSKPDQPIRFQLIATTGMEDSNAGHMQAMTIVGSSKDELVSTWTYFENGKPRGNRVLKLVPYGLLRKETDQRAPWTPNGAEWTGPQTWELDQLEDPADLDSLDV